MKKVLIITYYWPPTGGAGVQRWLKFTKYLREFGWEPVIYTVENPEMPETDTSLLNEVPPGILILKTRIWEPYSVYKMFTGRDKSSKIAAGFLNEKKKNPVLEAIAVWIRGNLFIPDARRFWIRPSVRFLTKFLRYEPVDALISTGPPHSCHLIALKIHKKTGIPWLADFRDPWTGIDFYQDLRLGKYADNTHHRLEKQVLASASEVVTVTPTMAKDFGFLYSRNYQVITNGYDAADFEIPEVSTPDANFNITHLGSMVPTRNPMGLWRALAELIRENHPLKNHLGIRLVGQVDHSVLQAIESFNLSRFLQKTEYVTHTEAIRILQSSQVLLLVINRTANTKNILTGKLFEYMAARRPILCIGPTDGDAAEAIRSTASGQTFDFDDVAGIKAHIVQLYAEFLNRSLTIPASLIQRYERKNLTRQLSIILNTMTENNQNHG